MSKIEVKKAIAKHLADQPDQVLTEQELNEDADAVTSLIALLIEADKELMNP